LNKKKNKSNNNDNNLGIKFIENILKDELNHFEFIKFKNEDNIEEININN